MRDYTKWALQEIVGWHEFEDICADYLFLTGYPSIRQAGRVGDGARDAVVLHDKKENTVFAFSMEENPLRGTSGKFHKEYAKWKGRGIKSFVFVSNRDLGAAKIDTPKGLQDPSAEIADITDLVRFLDHTPHGRRVKKNRGLLYEGSVQEETKQELLSAAEYTLMNLADLSHAAAKRYKADVLLNRQVSRERAKEILKEVTDTVRVSDYHRNERLRIKWRGHEADVVCLFLFLSFPDLARANWICRSQWVSDSLDEAFRPKQLTAEDQIEGISIVWNDMYEALAHHDDAFALDKETYLSGMMNLFEPVAERVLTATQLLKSYDTKNIPWPELKEGMEAIEEELTELYMKSTDFGLAPPECKELDAAFEEAMAVAHNAVLPFSDRFRYRPGEQEAVRQMRDALAQFPRHEQRVRSQLRRFRS